MRLELFNYLECFMQNYLNISVFETRDLYSLCYIYYENMFDQEKFQRMKIKEINIKQGIISFRVKCSLNRITVMYV